MSTSFPCLSRGRAGASRTAFFLLAAAMLFPGSPAASAPVPADQAVSPSNVPANAEAFISVRVADLWKTPLGKAFWEEAPPPVKEGLARAEERLGLKITDLERFTAVFQHVNDNLVWLVFTTGKPYDLQKIRTMIEEDSEAKLGEAAYQGKKYLVTSKGERGSLYQVSERTLVVAPEKSLKVLVDHQVKPRLDGPLASAIESASGKSHFVLAFAPSPEVLNKLPEGEKAPIDLKPFKVLKRALLSTTVTDRLNARLTLSFAEADSARGALPLLDAGKAMALEVARALAEKEPAAARSLKEAVDGMKIKQEGADVAVTLDVTINPEGLKPIFRSLFQDLLRPSQSGTNAAPPKPKED